MLILAIPQIETSVDFVFSLKLHIVPAVTRFFKINWVYEGLKKSNNFWAMVEAGAGPDVCNKVSPTL